MRAPESSHSFQICVHVLNAGVLILRFSEHMSFRSLHVRRNTSILHSIKKYCVAVSSLDYCHSTLSKAAISTQTYFAPRTPTIISFPVRHTLGRWYLMCRTSWKVTRARPAASTRWFLKTRDFESNCEEPRLLQHDGNPTNVASNLVALDGTDNKNNLCVDACFSMVFRILPHQHYLLLNIS